MVCRIAHAFVKSITCTCNSLVCHLRHAISVLYLLCFRARLFIDALWSPAGKGLTSAWLSFAMSTFVIVKLSLSYWYPGSGVVLGCIDY